MEQLERRVAIQFLNRDPLEPPVSKYGTAGTGVASLNVYKWFLNMKPLERRVAIQFLNKEPLEPIVSKYGTVGRGVASSFLRVANSWKQFLNLEPLEPPLSKYRTVGRGGCKQFHKSCKQLETVSK